MLPADVGCTKCACAKYHKLVVLYIEGLSACTYIPTQWEVGLIIHDALNKQVKNKWVWLTLC